MLTVVLVGGFVCNLHLTPLRLPSDSFSLGLFKLSYPAVRLHFSQIIVGVIRALLYSLYSYCDPLLFLLPL